MNCGQFEVGAWELRGLAVGLVSLWWVGVWKQGNVTGASFLKMAGGALNCFPERFKESCQESDSYENH